MKKKKNILLAIITCLVLCLQIVLAACDTSIQGEEFTMPEITNYSTYNNGDFSEYDNGSYVDNSLLPDQWEEYGAGDPYVFRYNGTYYLYVSTRDGQIGIRAWKSNDMIHWTKCTGEGLQEGYVCEDPVTIGAYAPEVYYFNGVFYLYSSPEGKGHYTFTSTDPEGPFVRSTDNYGMSIDGSVFVDDDEQMYFLNAGQGGIEIRKMTSLGNVPGNPVKLSSTALGWTEGPMIIKRNGIYYLTYTGTNVTSPGYRVSYSTELEGNQLHSRDAFVEGVGNPVLLEVQTEENFKGLGHSSTVLGPDLDSYYIVYHSLDRLTGHGPWRSLNIDRLVFNGTQMSVDGSKTNSIAANLPAFSAQSTSENSFNSINGMYLSDKSTGNVFTAEFNFVGDNVKCIVSYADANNYSYVIASYLDHKITLIQVAEGKERVIAEGSLVNDFNPGVIHTVRISYAEGEADVYFDNMCKIPNARITLSAGKIGYEGGEGYSTSFSNVGKGYSDRVELKQSGTIIGSSTYLPEGTYEGLQSYKLSKGSGVNALEVDEETDDYNYAGALELTLAKKGDYVRYATYFREGGYFGIDMTYDLKYAGKTIGIQVGNGDIQTVQLPEVSIEEDDYNGKIVTSNVAVLAVDAGPNIITIYAGEKVAFISFTATQKTYGDYSLSHDLKSVVENGVIYSSMYRLTEDGHATRSGNRMLAYFGDNTLADCEMEVEMRFMSNNIYSAGVVVRADKYATSSYDDNMSIQGYYIGLNSYNITLSKYNYNYSNTNLRFERHGQSDNITEHWFKMKIVVKGNTITVSLDGEEIFSYTDAHPIVSGHFGLYSEGAEVVYRNLKIKGI